MITNKIKHLFNTKYSGCRIMVANNEQCGENKLITYYINVTDEFIDKQDEIRLEIYKICDIVFANVEPKINLTLLFQ